jgi:predicted ester cyclase
MIKFLHAGLSDIRIEIIHCVSTGDVVATQKIIHGMHTGDFFGKTATGQKVRVTVMDFVKIKDGMISEHWVTLGSLKTGTEE